MKTDHSAQSAVRLLEIAIDHGDMVIASGIMDAVSGVYGDWTESEKLVHRAMMQKIAIKVFRYTEIIKKVPFKDRNRGKLTQKILNERGFISWEMLLLFLLAAEQEQKEQTLIDGESSIPKLKGS